MKGKDYLWGVLVVLLIVAVAYYYSGNKFFETAIVDKGFSLELDDMKSDTLSTDNFETETSDMNSDMNSDDDMNENFATKTNTKVNLNIGSISLKGMYPAGGKVPSKTDESCSIYDVTSSNQVNLCYAEGQTGSLFDFPRSYLHKRRAYMSRNNQRTLQEYIDINTVLSSPNHCKRDYPSWLYNPSVEDSYDMKNKNLKTRTMTTMAPAPTHPMMANAPDSTQTTWACYTDNPPKWVPRVPKKWVQENNESYLKNWKYLYSFSPNINPNMYTNKTNLYCTDKDMNSAIINDLNATNKLTGQYFLKIKTDYDTKILSDHLELVVYDTKTAKLATLPKETIEFRNLYKVFLSNIQSYKPNTSQKNVSSSYNINFSSRKFASAELTKMRIDSCGRVAKTWSTPSFNFKISDLTGEQPQTTTFTSIDNIQRAKDKIEEDIEKSGKTVRKIDKTLSTKWMSTITPTQIVQYTSTDGYLYIQLGALKDIKPKPYDKLDDIITSVMQGFLKTLPKQAFDAAGNRATIVNSNNRIRLTYFVPTANNPQNAYTCTIQSEPINYDIVKKDLKKSSATFKLVGNKWDSESRALPGTTFTWNGDVMIWNNHLNHKKKWTTTYKPKPGDIVSSRAGDPKQPYISLGTNKVAPISMSYARTYNRNAAQNAMTRPVNINTKTMTIERFASGQAGYHGPKWNADPVSGVTDCISTKGAEESGYERTQEAADATCAAVFPGINSATVNAGSAGCAGPDDLNSYTYSCFTPLSTTLTPINKVMANAKYTKDQLKSAGITEANTQSSLENVCTANPDYPTKNTMWTTDPKTGFTTVTCMKGNLDMTIDSSLKTTCMDDKIAKLMGYSSGAQQAASAACSYNGRQMFILGSSPCTDAPGLSQYQCMGGADAKEENLTIAFKNSGKWTGVTSTNMGFVYSNWPNCSRFGPSPSLVAVNYNPTVKLAACIVNGYTLGSMEWDRLSIIYTNNIKSGTWSGWAPQCMSKDYTFIDIIVCNDGGNMSVTSTGRVIYKTDFVGSSGIPGRIASLCQLYKPIQLSPGSKTLLPKDTLLATDVDGNIYWSPYSTTSLTWSQIPVPNGLKFAKLSQSWNDGGIYGLDPNGTLFRSYQPLFNITGGNGEIFAFEGDDLGAGFYKGELNGTNIKRRSYTWTSWNDAGQPSFFPIPKESADSLLVIPAGPPLNTVSSRFPIYWSKINVTGASTFCLMPSNVSLVL